MAVITLRPTSDGSAGGWAALIGQASMAAAMDDDPDSNDGDLSYAESPNAADGTCFILLDDVPSDFNPNAINSITIKVSHRRINTPAMAVDAGTVNAFLTRSDEATAISTTPTAVSSPIQAGYQLTSFTPSPTGTHTVSDWNGARLAIVFDHTSAQTTDVINQIRVTAVEVTIDYNPLVNHTLTADSGSFSETGTAATLLRTRIVDALTDAFVETGVAASLLVSFVVAATAGTFNLTGQDATLSVEASGYTVAADPGSYTVAGQAATLFKTYPLAADVGAYVETGTAALLEYERYIAADAGAFVETGTNASIEYERAIAADPGSFAATGIDASLLYGRAVVADAGTFTLTGADAGTTASRLLAADTGVYVETGVDAALSKSVPIVADPGTFALATSPYPTDRVVDSSGLQHHGTIKGTPTRITSPWSGFGDALDLDGTDADDASDGIVGPQVSSVGVGDFTLETKFRRDATTDVEVIASWWDWGAGGANYAGVFLWQWNDTTTLNCDFYHNNTLVKSVRAGTLGVGNHTCAIVRSGTAVYLYLNGSRIAIDTVSSWPSRPELIPAAGRMPWGRNPELGVDPLPMDGAVDEMRLSKVARYTGASYTVDTTPFTADANTLVLWHMDSQESAANLLASRTLAADSGAYVEAGQNATLTYSIIMAADSGSFALTGTAAGLTATRLLTADVGAYSEAGQAAGILYGRYVAGDAGTFTLTGTNASLLKASKIDASAGAYPLAGQDAGVLYGHLITSVSGAYSVSGTDASLTKQFPLAAQAGTFVLTGSDATLLKSGNDEPLDPGAFTLAGQAANILYNRAIVADSGAFVETGSSADLIYTRLPFVVDPGVYTVVGMDLLQTFRPLNVVVVNSGRTTLVENIVLHATVSNED